MSASVHSPHDAFDLVVMASSLGGVRALGSVLARLPDDFPAKVLVVQHLSDRMPSRLVDVLGTRCQLPVRWMTEGCTPVGGTVLVCPPGYHASFHADGTLAVARTPRVNFVRPSADVLLQSAADTYGSRLLVAVLTGSGTDGASGAAAAKRAGGRVLVQSLRTCAASGMPASAIRGRSVDLVLPLNAIAPALVSLVMVPGAADLLQVQSGPGEVQPNGMRAEDWNSAALRSRWPASTWC